MKWEETILEKIAEIKGGKRLPLGHEFTSDFLDNPYIRARDIKNGRIAIIDPVYINDNSYNLIKKYTVLENDICLTIVGAYVGDIGIVPKQLDGANLTENAVKIRSNEKICEQLFLAYYLQQKHIQQLMKQMSAVAAQPKLGIYKIKSIPIFLPPLPVQKKIASILSAYDDLIENNLRRIELLEKAARELYKEWFVRFRFPGHEKAKFKDGLPEGWERKKLGDVVTVNQENIKNDFSGNIDYIDIKSVSTGVIEKSIIIDIKDAPSRAKRKVKHGDIIWSCVRPNRKSYSIIYNPPKNQIVSTGFAVLHPVIIGTSYLYQITSTEDFVGYLTNIATGVAYPAVKKDDFENANIILPNEKIFNEFEKFTYPNIELKEKLIKQNQLLKQARDLLLPRFMKREIEV